MNERVKQQGCVLQATAIRGRLQGLLGAPEMQIAGNDSNAYQLNWYQDRSAGPLPTAWVISAPILLYRGLMLAWSLWLAYALLRWLGWAWECFSADGLWRPLRRRNPPSDAPPPSTEGFQQQ